MPIVGEKLIVNYFTVGEAGEPLSTDDGNVDELFDLNPLSTKLGILRSNFEGKDG